MPDGSYRRVQRAADQPALRSQERFLEIAAQNAQRRLIETAPQPPPALTAKPLRAVTEAAGESVRRTTNYSERNRVRLTTAASRLLTTWLFRFDDYRLAGSRVLAYPVELRRLARKGNRNPLHTRQPILEPRLQAVSCFHEG